MFKDGRTIKVKSLDELEDPDDYENANVNLKKVNVNDMVPEFEKNRNKYVKITMEQYNKLTGKRHIRRSQTK